MNPDSTGYWHTQRGPWGILLFALSAIFFTFGWWFSRNEPFALFLLLPMVGLLSLAELAALGENEWWIIDLSHELGIAFSTLARWSRRGWMHARKLSGRCRWWIVWADDQERDRLRRLYAYGRGKPQNGCRYPIELRTPARRSGESQLS